MKPIKENLSSTLAHSFRVKHSLIPYLDSPWHYHEEYELFYIIKSHGKRFIGDSIDNFSGGDLVFMGPNLPHVWINPSSFSRIKNKRAEAICIQFKENAFGDGFFNLPEFSKINNLFKQSKRGLLITGDTKNIIIPLMWKVAKQEGVTRIITLLEILNILANSQNTTPLASASFSQIYFESTNTRLNKVFNFIMNNYNKDIKLDNMAQLAGMTKTAFCRYFKKRTLKTLTQYVIEVRIGYAGKLLQSTDKPISDIAAEVGFNNLSYFIRKFRKHFNMNPMEYRAKLNQLLVNK